MIWQARAWSAARTAVSRQRQAGMTLIQRMGDELGNMRAAAAAPATSIFSYSAATLIR